MHLINWSENWSYPRPQSKLYLIRRMKRVTTQGISKDICPIKAPNIGSRLCWGYPTLVLVCLGIQKSWIRQVFSSKSDVIVRTKSRVLFLPPPVIIRKIQLYDYVSCITYGEQYCQTFFGKPVLSISDFSLIDKPFLKKLPFGFVNKRKFTYWQTFCVQQVFWAVMANVQLKPHKHDQALKFKPVNP